MAAVLATLTSLLNLWLAGRIVKFSGRLKRPWPELPAMVFPASTALGLAAAVAGTFATGVVGIVASALTASLLMAYVLLGFAVRMRAGRTSAREREVDDEREVVGADVRPVPVPGDGHAARDEAVVQRDAQD